MVESEKGIRGARRAGPGSGRRGGWGGLGEVRVGLDGHVLSGEAVSTLRCSDGCTCLCWVGGGEAAPILMMFLRARALLCLKPGRPGLR